MADNLALVERLIADHNTIRGHVKLAGDTVNDFEAIASARQTYAGWSQASVASLEEGRKRLQQALSALSEGLANHFASEEEVLPALFGKALMGALLIEHAELRQSIAEAARKVALTMEGLGQPELLARKTEIQHMMDGLCRTVEDHASREDMILGMLKKSLEKGGR
jgi:hemerythrin